MTDATAAAVEQTEDNFDYDAEFAAIVEKREGAKAQDAGTATDPLVVDDQAAQGSTDGGDGVGEAAPGIAAPAQGEDKGGQVDGSREPQEPATEPATEPAKPAVAAPAAEPAKPAAKPAAAAVVEPPETAREKALRERTEKLEQDNRSMAGRMSAYQRRYEEAKGIRAPAAEPVKASAADTAEWESFKTNYPEVAKAIEAKFAASQATAPAGAVPQDVVQYVQEKKRQEFLDDAWGAVDIVHPTWRADVKTKAFQDWKATSPTYEKLAASDEIADAVALMDLWRSQQPQAAVAAAAAAPDPGAAQLAARRQAQLAGAQSPANASASPNPGVDLNDEDQLWNFYSKKADNRRAKRQL